MTSPSAHIKPSEGDDRRERFLRLLREHRERLERFAFAMTRNADEAYDLVAETVVRAYQSFGVLRDEEAFLSYVFTIAVREQRRRRRREQWFGAFNEGDAERLCFTGTMPDVAADVRLLYAAINRLPARQREAIVLFEISGFSLKEIQEIQGGTIGSIKVRLHRARRSLAKLLGVEDPHQRQPESTTESEKNPDSDHELTVAMNRSSGAMR